MDPTQQNDLVVPQLSKGISVDVPTGSTIYDPAILSLREDFKAKVEERKAKQLHQSPKNDFPVESPMHVNATSPSPRRSRKSRKSLFFKAHDDSAAGSDSEDLELGDFEGETELCCNGYIPLYPFLTFMNTVKILAGIAGIAIGVFQLLTGGSNSVGVSSLERLVITGSFLFAIAFIVIGVLLIISGFLGIVLFTIRSRNTSVSAKRLDVVYHSGLFLLMIVLFVLFVLTVWVWIQTSRGDIYDSELWQELVRTDPLELCVTEERLECAAYELGQCKVSVNQTSNLFCPGHFCIDFCRITKQDVNVQPVCAVCRDESLRTIDTFVNCKRHETQFTNVTACMDVANTDLQVAYRRLLAAALVSFLWILVSVCVSTYQYCFS